VIVDVERGSGVTPPQPSPIEGEGFTAKRGINHRPDTIRVAKHVMIPKADDLITFAVDHFRSGCVRGFIVLPAIDFDDELRCVAGKVDDEMPDRDLAAKAMFTKGFAQQTPQFSFRVGGVGPETPSADNRACWRMMLQCLCSTPTVTPR